MNTLNILVWNILLHCPQLKIHTRLEHKSQACADKCCIKKQTSQTAIAFQTTKKYMILPHCQISNRILTHLRNDKNCTTVYLTSCDSWHQHFTINCSACETNHFLQLKYNIHLMPINLQYA